MYICTLVLGEKVANFTERASATPECVSSVFGDLLFKIF